MDLTAPPATQPLLLALDRELQPGERVVWHGAKLPRVMWGTLAIWLFAIPWLAFTVFWTVGASAGARAGQDMVGPMIWAFPLMALPFFAIGLVLLALPFLPLFARGRVVFAITDRRALRIGLFGQRLWTKSVDISAIQGLERKERRNGEGELQINLGSERKSNGSVRTVLFTIGEVANVMAADRALHAQMTAPET